MPRVKDFRLLSIRNQIYTFYCTIVEPKQTVVEIYDFWLPYHCSQCEHEKTITVVMKQTPLSRCIVSELDGFTICYQCNDK